MRASVTVLNKKTQLEVFGAIALSTVENWTCLLFPSSFFRDVTDILSCSSCVTFCCFPSSLPVTAPFRSCLFGLPGLSDASLADFHSEVVVVRDVQRQSQWLEQVPLGVNTPKVLFSCGSRPVLFKALLPPCLDGYVLGSPFGYPLVTRHKKVDIEEWLHVPAEMIQWVEDNGIPDRVPPLPGPATAPPTWRWEEAPLPPPRPKTLTNVVHLLPSVVELRRLALPFAAEHILSCYEPDVTVRNDSFTLWSLLRVTHLPFIERPLKGNQILPSKSLYLTGVTPLYLINQYDSASTVVTQYLGEATQTLSSQCVDGPPHPASNQCVSA